MHRKSSLFFGALVGLFLLFTASCSRGELYYKYHHLSLGKWDADSILVFPIDSVQGDIHRPVQLVLMLTVNQTYAYQDLNLNVSENLSGDDFNVKQMTLPILSKDGIPQGSGVSTLKQFTFPITHTRLSTDSTLQKEVRIRHAMTDNPLRGVESVGICLLPSEANPHQSPFLDLFQQRK